MIFTVLNCLIFRKDFRFYFWFLFFFREMTSLNDELLSDDEEAEIAEDQENSQDNEVNF